MLDLYHNFVQYQELLVKATLMQLHLGQSIMILFTNT